jgi:UDP-glucose 4-epimerase
MRVRRSAIAVTGTKGLLGSRLVERLEEAESCRKIVLLDLVPPKTRSRKTVFHRVDLTDASASERIADALRREQVSLVVHLAQLQHPTRNLAYARELEIVGTGRLLAAVASPKREAGGVPLVFASSTMLYGARPDNPNFLCEPAPLRARSSYAFVHDKVAVEEALRAHAEERKAAITVLRFAPILDAGHRSLASRYFSLPTVPTVLGFNPLVQLLGADDAVEAILRAIAVGPEGHRVFNVAAPGTLPLLAAIRLVGRTSMPAPRFLSAPILDALFQAGAAIAPSPHLDYLRWLFVADGERAAAELDFRARRSTRDVALAFGAASVPRAA